MITRAGVAALLAPGGSLSVLFSVVPRDGVPALREDVASAYAAAGLAIESLRAGSGARAVTRIVARPASLIACPASPLCLHSSARVSR